MQIKAKKPKGNQIYFCNKSLIGSREFELNYIFQRPKGVSISDEAVLVQFVLSREMTD